MKGTRKMPQPGAVCGLAAITKSPCICCGNTATSWSEPKAFSQTPLKLVQNLWGWLAGLKQWLVTRCDLQRLRLGVLARPLNSSGMALKTHRTSAFSSREWGLWCLLCNEEQRKWWMWTGSVEQEAVHRFQGLIALYWTLKWVPWLACSLMLCNDNRSCTSWSLWLAEFPKTLLSFLSHYPLRQVGREYLFIVILDIYK